VIISQWLKGNTNRKSKGKITVFSLDIMLWLWIRVVVFSATFNNISIISWRSVWMVEEKTEYSEKTTDILYHIMLYRVHLALSGIQTHNFSCTGSYKSNYHTITTTTNPLLLWVFNATFINISVIVSKWS
jgi:hypothetical protein